MSATGRMYDAICEIAYGRTFRGFLNELKKKNYKIYSDDYKWETVETDISDYSKELLKEIWEETNYD